jgi:hypothetical protein
MNQKTIVASMVLNMNDYITLIELSQKHSVPIRIIMNKLLAANNQKKFLTLLRDKP